MLSAYLSDPEGSIKEFRSSVRQQTAPADLKVKMKASLAVCAVFLVVLVSGMEAIPIGDHPQATTFDENIFAPAIADHGDRHRRVTCDILSLNTPWGSFGHAACAAHCLAMMKGYRGGYCDNHGVCNCRK